MCETSQMRERGHRPNACTIEHTYWFFNGVTVWSNDRIQEINNAIACVGIRYRGGNAIEVDSFAATIVSESNIYKLTR
jgi:hypothetical protein